MLTDNVLEVVLPSSFVNKKRKLEKEKGNGEAKLYLGHSNDKEKFDNFFNDFDKDNVYVMHKEQVRDFLLSLFIEYKFEIFNKYNDVGEKEFESTLKEVDNLPNEICFSLEKHIDKARYYIRSSQEYEKDWTFLLRKVPLPKISKLKIVKKNHQKFVLSLEIIDDFQKKEEIESLNSDVNDDSSLPKKGINKIYYGAPGTGKSYMVDNLYKNFDRITFHPEYTYFDFVGGLRPVQNQNKIVYKFVPGPFAKILKEALLNKGRYYGLIIEELNRANTAGVFGDIFQLLDRGENGASKYPINNNDLLDYLKSEGIELDEIFIPANLSIVATMNSADQGVYVLDSAFKRRWQFEYIPIDFDEKDLQGVKISGFDMEWAIFGKVINSYLSSKGIEEDKLIGQRFINKSDLNDINMVSSKLLIYLWDDVVRYDRGIVFKRNKVFSELISDFKKNGINCLNDELCAQLKLAIENENNLNKTYGKI